MDAVIMAVSHTQFADYKEADIAKLFKKGQKKVFADIKGVFERKEYEDKGYLYWRL